MKLFLIRASHANQFELQNYELLASDLDIEVISSQHPLTPTNLRNHKLWSPTDLPGFPYRKQILNRAIGGEQWLFGLEKYILEKKSNDSNHRTILHTAETYTPYTHQAVALRKRGAIDKLVCTCWETIPHNNEKFARFRKWKREAYKYVDLFHAPTVRAKKALIQEGVSEAKIQVIPYGIDIDRFKPGKKIKHKKPVVLTVARLEKEKGVDLIQEIAKILPDYEFRIIGVGTERLKGENIVIKNVPYSSIHHEYQQADLFLLPSRSTPTWEEQYGMAILEAMASGLPLVVSDSGAIPEVVGDTGMVIKQYDMQSYIRTVRKLIQDASLRQELSDKSLAAARKLYDRKKLSRTLKNLYL